jgi:hypothetical protein
MAASKNRKTYRDAKVIDGLKSRTSGAASESTSSSASSAPSYVFGPKSAALKKCTVANVSEERGTRSRTAKLAKNKLANGTTISRRPKLIVEVHVPPRQVNSTAPAMPNSVPTAPSPSQAVPTALPAHPLPPSLPHDLSQSPHLDESDVRLTPQSPPFSFESPSFAWRDSPTGPTATPTPSFQELFPPPDSPILHRNPTPLFLNSDEEEVVHHAGNNTSGSHNSVGGDDAEDETGAVLAGGRLSSSQVSEVHDIVRKMHAQIEAKAKEWRHSTESLLRVGNVVISTKERRHGGNSWNAFQSTFERDSDEKRSHSEYVETVVKPAYDALIREHGGVDSAEWKAKAEQLIEEHRSMKAAAAIAIAQQPSDVGRAMKQTFKRWEDDLKWLATLNVHGLAIMVSGIPDPAASKHNSMACGSKPMHDWAAANLPIKSSLLPLIHSHIVASQGEPLLQMKRMQPKDMHKMRKEIKDELQALVLPFKASIARVPWANLSSFFANNHLKVENWPLLAEFPAIQSLAVDQVRTESWRSLWLAFFNNDPAKRIKVSSLADLAKANGERLPNGTVLVSDRVGRALVTVETDSPDSDHEGVDRDGTHSVRPSKRGAGGSGPMQGNKRQRTDGSGSTERRDRHYKSSEFIEEELEDGLGLPESRPAPGVHDPNHAASLGPLLHPITPISDDVLGNLPQIPDFGSWESGELPENAWQDGAPPENAGQAGMQPGNVQSEDDMFQSHLLRWTDLSLGLNDIQST